MVFPVNADLTISYKDHRRHLKAVEELIGRACDQVVTLKARNEELTALLRASETQLLLLQEHAIKFAAPVTR